MTAQAAIQDPRLSLAGTHVCSIITSLTSGGAEILVTNLNTHYAKYDVLATVAAFCDAPTLGNSAAMEAELNQRLAQADCRFRSLSMKARRGLWQGALALRRFVRDQRPDIIHVHTVRGVLMLALANCGVPIVFTHHNSRLSFPPSLFLLLDRVVACYVAISTETAALYLRHSRRPFVLIPNAPDPTFRVGAPRLTCAPRARILSVGAISEQKNYPLLIETARTMRDNATAANPAPIFRVAGGGAELENLRARVSKLGLEDVVEFLGERSDIAALLADSDIYLNTSRYEGFSIAILEALSSAIPVVATDVPGNRGLVKPGQNGLLPPSDRPTALASAIGRISGDAAFYRQLSLGAMRSARDYTIEGAARRHLDLYASLLRRTESRKD